MRHLVLAFVITAAAVLASCENPTASAASLLLDPALHDTAWTASSGGETQTVWFHASGSGLSRTERTDGSIDETALNWMAGNGTLTITVDDATSSGTYQISGDAPNRTLTIERPDDGTIVYIETVFSS